MTTRDIIYISALVAGLFVTVVGALTILVLLKRLSSRVLHILPWSLAGIYAAWCVYILFRGGDWAPVFLLYPLWPFGVLLALLTKSIPNSFPEGVQGFLDVAIWLIGGMVWYFALGQLASRSAIGIARLFHKRVRHDA